MNCDKLFTVWWLVFGSKFEEKLGFSATKKELARYAFQAGVKAGEKPATAKDKEA